MAQLIKQEYDPYDYGFDEDGIYNVVPYVCWYQENGLVFRCYPNNRGEAYVCDICENTESVYTPDIINTRYGEVKITIWQVPNNSSGAKTIKHIHFGKSIKEFCMYDCKDFKNLETVEFDANVTWLSLGFFQGCTKLKNVTFREDSPLEHISSDCFSGCTSLRSFSFPRNVKAIEKNAFAGCDNLESITVHFPTEQLLESIVDIKSVKKISIIKNSGISVLGLNAIEELRRKYAIAKRKRIEEEERKQKYADFDSYQNKRSKTRIWFHAIMCALPFLYFSYNYINNIFIEQLSTINIVLNVFALLIVLFLELIAWSLSVMLSDYVDYFTKEKNIWVSIFSPLITIPAALFIIYVALLVISIVTTCSTGLAGIFDPRFL